MTPIPLNYSASQMVFLLVLTALKLSLPKCMSSTGA